MRTARNGVLLFLLSLVTMFVIGCSDDDNDSPTGGNNAGGAVDLSSATIDIPPAMATAASSNTGAAQAQGYLQMLNSFSAYSSFMTAPAAKIAEVNDGVYTWTSGGLSITMTIVDQGSEITWDVVVNGSDGQTTYENFTLIDGYQEKDGSSGNLSIYAPSYPSAASAFWTWGTSPTGVFTSSYYDNLSGVNVDATVNTDGSGSVYYYAGQTIQFGSTWNTDGSGSYTIYDGSGQQIDSGSWPS